ncbi:hypothetical protein niasHT_010064 [Heterodera trifolii]|uniref:Uncharacterized protein n=1 Tax=Heterodera trifolii TaxID=157864 RepID=A0ABD2LYE9_9BILA
MGFSGLLFTNRHPFRTIPKAGPKMVGTIGVEASAKRGTVILPMSLFSSQFLWSRRTCSALCENVAEMSTDEIVNGNTDFPGLAPLMFQLLNSADVNTDTRALCAVMRSGRKSCTSTRRWANRAPGGACRPSQQRGRDEH